MLKEVGKPSLTIFVKNNDNQCLLENSSLGFSPILQKFDEMICEIIISKAVPGIFFNFMEKNNFSEP